jgi:SulP family sulfate permease
MRFSLFLLFTATALVVGVSEGKSFPSALSSTLHNNIPRGGAKQRNKPNKFFVAKEVVINENNANNNDGGVTANLVPEVLAGMTVALASIPSSIAFASIAGVDPMVGVWSSVILGSVSSFAGMRAGLIAGSAGVVVVPLATIISSYGKQYMAPTVILACLMEFVFSIAKGGKLINYVSDPVMSGFLNGLGCLLLRSQFKVFMSSESSDGALSLLPKAELTATAGITALTGALSLLLPMILPGNAWPTSLMAIAAATIAAQVLNLPVQFLSVGDSSSSDGSAFDGSWHNLLPKFVGFPTNGEASILSGKTLKLVAPAAFSIAVISLLETLLAVKVVDDADGTSASRKEHKKNAGDAYDATTENKTLDKSCMSMALGNSVSALFGGFGGCGLIPQTLLNIQSGGRGTLSVVSYAFIMAVSILFSSSLIKMVPTSTLAGVMILVALRTIQWKPTTNALAGALDSVKNKSGESSNTLASFVALTVSSVVCYKVDMGSGIILGVLLDKLLPTVFDRII